MNNPYLFTALALTPSIFLNLSKKLSEEQLDFRVDQDHFSLREAICHIADFEPIFRQRIKNTVDSPGHTFQGVDPDLLAANDAYSGRELSGELEKLRTEREMTISLLKSLTPEHWKLSSTHAERGVMSIEDQASLLVCHDVYHIDTFAKAIAI